MVMNYKKFYKKKKVLITGVTGFKGAWLGLWLNLLGAKVYGVGYKPNNNKRLFDQLNLRKKISFQNIDIRNYKKLSKHIKKIKPEIIFHLAAQPIISKSYEDPLSTYEINSLGTLNLIEIVKINFLLNLLYLLLLTNVIRAIIQLKDSKRMINLGALIPIVDPKQVPK